MSDGFGLAVAAAAILIAIIFEMVRRRYVRGRFAVIWALVALSTLTLAVAPNILGWAAEVTGVHVPLNLLFFTGFVGLLIILVQLTAAHGKLERQVRALAEQIALARSEGPTEEDVHPASSGSRVADKSL